MKVPVAVHSPGGEFSMTRGKPMADALAIRGVWNFRLPPCWCSGGGVAPMRSKKLALIELIQYQGQYLQRGAKLGHPGWPTAADRGTSIKPILKGDDITARGQRSGGFPIGNGGQYGINRPGPRQGLSGWESGRSSFKGPVSLAAGANIQAKLATADDPDSLQPLQELLLSRHCPSQLVGQISLSQLGEGFQVPGGMRRPLG